MLIRLKLVGVAFCFAGTFTAGRIVAAEFSPWTAAFLRFAIATAALFIICARSPNRPRPTWRNLGWFMLLAGSGVVAYNLCFFAGLRQIEASRASLIIALNPVGIALGARLLFGETLGPRRTLGLLLAVTGAINVVLRGDWSALRLDDVGGGEVWILGCVASWVTYTLTGRLAGRELANDWLVLGAIGLGTVALLPLAASEGTPSAGTPMAWLSLGFLGLFGSAVAFLWYQEGIRQLGAARAGAFICLVPVFGALIAAAVLGESLTPSVLVGAALVGGGLTLAQAAVAPARSRPTRSKSHAAGNAPG